MQAQGEGEGGSGEAFPKLSADGYAAGMQEIQAALELAATHIGTAELVKMTHKGCQFQVGIGR